MTDPKLMMVPEAREEARRRTKTILGAVAEEGKGLQAMLDGGHFWLSIGVLKQLCDLDDDDSYGWWLRWLDKRKAAHVMGNDGRGDRSVWWAAVKDLAENRILDKGRADLWAAIHTVLKQELPEEHVPSKVGADAVTGPGLYEWQPEPMATWRPVMVKLDSVGGRCFWEGQEKRSVDLAGGVWRKIS